MVVGAVTIGAATRLRRPGESDHPAVVAVLDEWWGGRRVRHRLPRLWFRHFAATSWLAERPDGALVGIVVGLVSPEHAAEAQLYLLGVDPNHRRRGIGRTLEAAFADDVRGRGTRTIRTELPTGDPVALRAMLALGYEVDAGPGTSPIHGTPAYADHDGPGEDRIVLLRRLAEAPEGGSS